MKSLIAVFIIFLLISCNISRDTKSENDPRIVEHDWIMPAFDYAASDESEVEREVMTDNKKYNTGGMILKK